MINVISTHVVLCLSSCSRRTGFTYSFHLKMCSKGWSMLMLAVLDLTTLLSSSSSPLSLSRSLSLSCSRSLALFHLVRLNPGQKRERLMKESVEGRKWVKSEPQSCFEKWLFISYVPSVTFCWVEPLLRSRTHAYVRTVNMLMSKKRAIPGTLCLEWTTLTCIKAHPTVTSCKIRPHLNQTQPDTTWPNERQSTMTQNPFCDQVRSKVKVKA